MSARAGQSSATWSLGAILSLGLASGPASAKPDACTTNSSTSTVTCQGNQSAGVKDGTDFAATTITVQLQSLTTNVTPASGVAGVNHFAQPGSGISDIKVNFSGSSFAIGTTGSAAHGILAGGQGHSGSGGSFGTVSSGSVGGAGGQVTVSNTAELETHGYDAIGIHAQSIGGTGGDGGSTGGIVALGGGGGSTSPGGQVTVTNSANLVLAALPPGPSTTGPDPTCGTGCSHGILAQSIGGDGYLVRPRVAVGVTHFLQDPSPSVSARFQDAPPGSPSFQVTSDVDRTTLDLEVGLDVLAAGGVVLGLGGFAQVGESTSHVGGGARLAVPF
jgi:hypothetical protein